MLIIKLHIAQTFSIRKLGQIAAQKNFDRKENQLDNKLKFGELVVNYQMWCTVSG